jgi:L-asparaginase / beta-aspartyl-peptidase
MAKSFSLMIHGGAGELDRIKNPDTALPYLDSIRAILEHGRKILEQDGSALDAVETCAAMLEDEPMFNAGKGSVLNDQGKVENDAAIMDGRNLGAGAVAGLTGIANPVKLARVILSECEHVLLIGEGARQFATQYGIESVSDDYLITDYRRIQFEKARSAGNVTLDQDPAIDPDDKYGTIGAVARDSDGNLAAATSTGGMVNKMRGRVGDSPIIGAGVFADNLTCAVSATGYGEDFMRTVLAKHISNLIEFKRLDAKSAVRQSIDYLVNRVNGRGGVIVVDSDGYCASGFSTMTMIHGWIEHGSKIICVYKDTVETSK